MANYPSRWRPRPPRSLNKEYLLSTEVHKTKPLSSNADAILWAPSIARLKVFIASRMA